MGVSQRNVSRKNLRLGECTGCSGTMGFFQWIKSYCKTTHIEAAIKSHLFNKGNALLVKVRLWPWLEWKRWPRVGQWKFCTRKERHVDTSHMIWENHIGQRRQIHQKQKWSMEFCCFCFRVQIHKPLVHDLQRASMNKRRTEASLLELRGFMTLRFPGQSKYHWRPDLAPLDQVSRSRTKINLQVKY